MRFLTVRIFFVSTGHYHRNAGGVYSGKGNARELEVVTTSAVGMHLIATPEATAEERLGLAGFSAPAALSAAESGASQIAPTLPRRACTQ